ncbi:hypothetical protein COCNU_08G006700 [Cocos nucifera]|uniref:Uncharacterized protein n=1 Tax=Cocos nucifera TaxID=13894 RepID=A0A8K0IHX4_COCNU|nr:hypothetical protein COCNU_08G006700 [Cocos nucifera]
MVGSAAGGAVKVEGSKFKDPRWVGGTWDLKQFEKNGKTDWDAVIDAGYGIRVLMALQNEITYEKNKKRGK